MTYITKLISKAYEVNKLICICLDRIDWNSRLIGYVINIYSITKFKFKSFDEFGQTQKTRTISFDAVKSLEVGGIYNDNLEKLIQTGFKREGFTAKHHYAKNESLLLRIGQLKASKTICTFFFGAEFCVGKVQDFTDEELFITNIGFDGKKDGISIVDISQLTKVRFDSKFEKRISIFAKRIKKNDVN